MSGKSNFILIGLFVIGLIAVVGPYVSVLRSDGHITWANPENRQLVERGAPIYAENCASCHGDNLEGQPNWRIKNADGALPAPPHDATGHTWHHPDELLFQITKHGGQKNAPAGFKSGMPEFGETLSDGDIWAVLAYIKSRWPEDIRKRHAQMSQRAMGN